MTRRLKILLSAYACEPGKGSEPEVGWQWATRLAREHDVTVLTRANNEAAIRAGLERLPGPHPEFIFLSLPRFLERGKKTWLPLPLFYLLWQAAARLQLRGRLGRFDIIHHVTFNAYRWPGVWWFTGRPVILGPLGGGQTCPRALLPLFGRARIGEWLRSALIRCSRWNPLHVFQCRNAARLLVANADTARCIPPSCRSKLTLMLETGIEPSGAGGPAQDARSGNGGELRLIWVGGLVPRKALPLALHALAIAVAKGCRARLGVAGDGPESAMLISLAARLGIAAQVDWLGRVPHAEMVARMRAQDALLFTSIRDTSGNVILEAMAAGLPVITLNHQGAAEMTTGETALRITPGTVEETSERLAQAIVTLAEDAALRGRLGRAGAERVRTHFHWPQKAAEMSRVYREVADAAAT